MEGGRKLKVPQGLVHRPDLFVGLKVHLPLPIPFFTNCRFSPTVLATSSWKLVKLSPHNARNPG